MARSDDREASARCDRCAYFVGPPDLRGIWRRAWRTLGWSLVYFLAACFITYWLEHFVEEAIGGVDNPSAFSQSIFGARNVYQALVTAWPRRLVPRYTVLVPIDPISDPTAKTLGLNVCQQRSYLARLLPAIAAHDPAVIVIDRTFSEDACDEGSRTLELKQAIAAVSARIPVVVGLEIKETKGGIPTVDPTISFSPNPLLREGLTNLDVDSRRLSLGWTIQRTNGAAPQWFNAIALEAALAYEPLLPKKYEQLEKLRQEANNPYMSLIAESAFDILTAADLLCPLPNLEEAMIAQCALSRKPSSVDTSYLRGRTVFVGQLHSGRDRHDTVVGRMPGLHLQANSLEAILDQRYFEPVLPWIDYLIGLMLYVAIEASLRHSSTIVSIALVCVSLFTTFVLLSLTVRYSGYYVSPVTVGLLPLAIKLIARGSEHFTALGRPRHGS